MTAPAEHSPAAPDPALVRATGSAGAARALTDLLRQLADARAGQEWAELAEGALRDPRVLAGMATTSAYGHLFEDAFRAYRGWSDTMDSHERDDMLAEARRALGAAVMEDPHG
jgi:hypothetical protein